MKILIQFEDNYGCRELFSYCSSVLNSEEFKVTDGNGCTGVFRLSNKQLLYYDYIFIIFDMDNSEDGHSVLTPELLTQRLINFSGLNSKKRNTLVRNKIILIPVFFCFETIPLFSGKLQYFIDTLTDKESRKEIEILKVYKKHYNISIINPELFKDILNYNSEHYIANIQSEVYTITHSVNAGKTWNVQRFYASYYKNLLEAILASLYKNEDDFKLNSIEILKRENLVFKTLLEYQCPFNPYEILDSFLKTTCQFNIYLQRLYSIKDLADLKSMTYENTIEDIMQKIKKYNDLLKGFLDQNIATKVQNKQNIQNQASPSNAFFK